ncbi:hypothetical protein NKG05_03200 [Oerskovia sp. M15]
MAQGRRAGAGHGPDAIGSVHAGDLIDSGSNETQWVNWFKGMEGAAATSNVMAAPATTSTRATRARGLEGQLRVPAQQPTTETIGELAQLAVGDTRWPASTPRTSSTGASSPPRRSTSPTTRACASSRSTQPATPRSSRPTRCRLLRHRLPAGQGRRALDPVPGRVARHRAHREPVEVERRDVPPAVFSTSSGRDEPVLRKYWVPVFQEHDIDLVMMGHDHTYARGYVNEDRTDTEGVTDGPVYIVSNSGAKHYDLAAPDKNVWTNNGATQVLRGEKITTYQVVDVTADTLTYRSYIAEKVAGASTDLPMGAVYDEFTVTKRDDGTKWVTEAAWPSPAR